MSGQILPIRIRPKFYINIAATHRLYRLLYLSSSRVGHAWIPNIPISRNILGELGESNRIGDYMPTFIDLNYTDIAIPGMVTNLL